MTNKKTIQVNKTFLQNNKVNTLKYKYDYLYFWY